MSRPNDLKFRLAFLGEGDKELKFLEALSEQIPAPPSRVYSTSPRQLQEYKNFACDYCVLYPTAASDEVIKSLVAVASQCPSAPKIILLLQKQSTAKLEKDFEELGTHPQIIRLENPDILRAVELVNAFFILKKKFPAPHPGWEFVGASAPVHDLYDSISSFAPWHKDPVLIFGETGTGKELIARCLHDIRNKGSFRAYNVAAIPVDLTESILFGHTKGAFTGATNDTKGYIVEAGDGTLLIDEIGEAQPSTQVKLLRTLQERKVFKLGEEGSEGKSINARFVFATNRDLKEACREGKFREDLFHRISSLQIVAPKLRERKADIPLLVDHFVDEFKADYKDVVTEMCLDNVFELSSLFDYEWPGNVRELRNIVRQAAALTGKGAIDKKLSKLVGDRIRESEENRLQTNPSQGGQHSCEASLFMNSLLNDTRPNAEDRLKKAYGQALFLKTNGDLEKMKNYGDIEKTTIYKIKKQLRLSQFKTGDLIAAADLATKLKQQSDPVSKYIYKQFDPRTKQRLNAYNGEDLDISLLNALVAGLNQQLQDPNLYQAERFRHVQLSEETQELIEQHEAWTDLFQLNRRLIEDTYSREITRSSPAQKALASDSPDTSPLST